MKYRENPSEPWKELYIKALDSMVIGSIIQFVGTTIPTGWLECDGSTITQSAYPELYDLIGGTLPDLRGKVLVGQDTNDTDFDTLLETGGSKTNKLIPENYAYETWMTQTYDADIRKTTTFTGDNYGMNARYSSNINTPVNNLQPYAVVKHIIKATNTTPTMASVVNTTNSSTTDAYSCDYVNNLVDYSTTEMNTGKRWIDGKPIYRKVVEGTLSTGTGQKIIQHNITNLDNLISCIGSIKIGTTNEWYLLPFSAAIDAVSTYGISIQYINGSHIAYFVGSGMGTNVKYTKAIIEYTKTTD